MINVKKNEQLKFLVTFSILAIDFAMIRTQHKLPRHSNGAFYFEVRITSMNG